MCPGARRLDEFPNSEHSNLGDPLRLNQYNEEMRLIEHNNGLFDMFAAIRTSGYSHDEERNRPEPIFCWTIPCARARPAVVTRRAATLLIVAEFTNGSLQTLGLKPVDLVAPVAEYGPSVTPLQFFGLSLVFAGLVYKASLAFWSRRELPRESLCSKGT